MRELLRVFNILIDNPDGHEKNHTLRMTDAQQCVATRGYRVLARLAR